MIYNLTGFSDVRNFPLFLVIVFKFAYLLELTKGYQPAKFQYCKLSGSNFAEGLQKHNDDVIMTSFHIFVIRNFHIF